MNNETRKPIVLISTILFKTPLETLMKSFSVLQRNSSAFEYRIVIVDNDNGNQKDEFTEVVEKSFPADFNGKITYVPSANIGFGRGHNLAFNTCKDDSFDYFLIINPDGVLNTDTIDILLETAKNKNDNGLFEAIQFPREHPKEYDPKTLETHWCSGCCMMAPKAVYADIGGFDDDLFMYCEDVDISWRARIAGYKCYTANTALFAHYVDVSTRDLTFMTREMNRSGLILACKYGNKMFADFCVKALKSMISEAEIQNIIDTTKKYDTDFLEKSKNVTDFNHFFSFGRVRW